MTREWLFFISLFLDGIYTCTMHFKPDDYDHGKVLPSVHGTGPVVAGLAEDTVSLSS